MSTQDDELKLDPPEISAPAPVPPPAAPVPSPEPADPPAEPERPESELEPGRGRPLVEGPPMSVSEPVSESSINRTAAFAGLGLLGLGLLLALIVLLVVVFALCR